jgi:hypothetical protein
MEFVLDAYCGLYCGACPNLLATKTGIGNNLCLGCKSEQPTAYCATCGIKSCNQNKGYEFCYQCTEINSCELLKKFISDSQWPYQQGVLKNMEMIHNEGKKKWLEDQEKRWHCTNCGTPQSWFTETCPQCGQTVGDYKADL